MKFVSKMSNLRIVLRPGIQAQPITGTPAVPTLFLQFKDGVAETENEEILNLILKHRGLERIFIKVEEGTAQKFEANKTAEPVHVLSEIEHGKVKNRSTNPIGKTEAQEKMEKLVKEEAKKIALAMIPELLKEMAKENNPTEIEVIEEVTKEPETDKEVVEKPKTNKKDKKNK